MSDSAAAVEPPYRVLRNVSRNSKGRLLHQGADLGNQRSGGIVQAVAAGIVVYAARDQSGYGEHVVVAHRMADGTLIYSVYAHLIRGSTLVSEGDGVQSGTPLGEVGRTGRATTPHLHFEIRQPADPTTSWQLAPVLDPLEFLAARAVAAAAASRSEVTASP
jgi:murein DD-endopeptidase MepM/ murein hydrolase activator NlpD